MSKKISEIYTEYKILPSLGEHMLRVAAVASLICENFSEPLLKNNIVTACLLHDMGNIIKFKMDIIPEFFEPEGVEYWSQVKDEYVKKYGEDEHKATIKIMREINLPANILFLADQIAFSLVCDHSLGNDMNTKIVFYADARVGPHGVLSYEDRMEDGKRRYKNHKSTFGGIAEEERQKLVACGKDIERQIFSKCRIKPEDINDETIKTIISSLRDFVIE